MFNGALITAVFTTKFVTIDKRQITLVKHNSDDNTWEFYSNDKFDDFEKVAKVVSLEDMIAIDNSILEISDLKSGYFAHRDSKSHNWVIEPQKNK
jgi:hypothetical protein